MRWDFEKSSKNKILGFICHKLGVSPYCVGLVASVYYVNVGDIWRTVVDG